MSTLRRRIKTNKIQFKLEDGKYFILEDESSRVSNEQARASETMRTAVLSSESISTTRLLLDELKRAYLDSLQSKEDQILYLKQQVSDLKTLVLLLEKENSRMQGGE
ncbi:hypothetical protein K2X05_08265 [bacterium]|nr:hypothetical protein [bacterium]